MRKSALLHTISACSLVVLLLTVLGGPGLQAQDRNPAGHEFPYMRLRAPVRGSGAIAALGAHFPEVAKYYGKSENELRSILARDRTIWADVRGRLLYVCENDPLPPEAPIIEADGSAMEGPLPYDQTFLLHSRPGAKRVIYLDFDGHTTTGTPWNSGRGDIVSAPFDLDGNPSAWSTAEQDVIQYIWQRVAEDFAPFEVDVTTQDPGIEGLRKTSSSDEYYGQRVVISPTNWYSTNAGGVAYIGSFNWSSDTPCFAFTAQLANGEKYIAEAASHETGHTLGLYHDGTTTGVEYYSGHGDWAPIMGVGYYKNIVQWSKGEYANANNKEDDLAIIPTYGIPYRADDHGDYIDSATPLTGTSINASGLIEDRFDTDVFKFNSGAGTISLTATPAPRSPNLDIEMSLFDGTGNLLMVANPTGLSATLSTAVSAGTYYIRIDGVGTGDPTTGYSDYASIGQYAISGTVPNPGTNQPPTAKASASPASGPAPLAVNFSSAGSMDSDGSIVTYSWSFGDGTGSSLPNPAHTYDSEGTFVATLIVTDNGGLSSTDTVAITVTPTPNKPPIAVVAATPTSGYAPLNVSFSSGGSSDPDGTIVSWSWTFGDGGTSNSENPWHAYTSAGNFTATLTVTDDRGATNSKSITIAVSNNPNQTLHVADIAMSKVVSRPGTFARAAVTIRDAAGTVVPGVLVTGRWSGLVTGTSNLATGPDGVATFASKATKKSGTFTFTVTGVSKSGYTYDPSQNAETNDSIVK
jgi:PKD repeat protein